MIKDDQKVGLARARQRFSSRYSPAARWYGDSPAMGKRRSPGHGNFHFFVCDWNRFRQLSLIAYALLLLSALPFQTKTDFLVIGKKNRRSFIPALSAQGNLTPHSL